MRRLIGTLLAAIVLTGGRGSAVAQEDALEGTLTLSGAWAIYPTAVAWAEAFQKLHPNVKIDVSAGGAGKGAADAIAGLVDIGMVSREPDPSEIRRGITPVYVLHDAVFVVISGNNPALGVLLKKGVRKQVLFEAYVSGLRISWGQIAENALSAPLHLYTRSDSCGAAASWAGYLGKKQEDLKGIGVYGDPGLLEVVRKDALGIGYNNFSYVFSRDGELVSGVRLLPIDSNENGVADPDEIFLTRDDAVKAITAGRYPATRKNYFFVKGAPGGLMKAFIAFALSDEGARIVEEVGASLPLTGEERNKVLESLK